MPIPKFAKEIAKRAKAKPKIILKDSLLKNIQTKSDTKTHKTKFNSVEILESVNISKMASKNELKNYGYKPGQKVKIYNANNENEFVEIIWPSNPTQENIMRLIEN